MADAMLFDRLQQLLNESNRSDLATVLPDIQSTINDLLNTTFTNYTFDTFVNCTPASPDVPDVTPSATHGQNGKKPIRAYVDGCFDLMHSGHYNAIRQARSICDILVVGVHSDAEILHHKGATVMNNEERLATVKACKWVDEIVFDTPYNPSLELLDKLNCDFCIHGDDMSTTADGVDAYAETKAAGRMKVIKRTEGISTTDLVGRLLLMTRNHHMVSKTTSPVVTTRQISDTLNRSRANSLLDDIPQRQRHLSSTGSNGRQTQFAQSHGISNFLPTTYRISQFSSGRTPAADDTIVYIDGAFDLFHLGHIETLKRAKQLGTFLYVGVHDDSTVNKHKGANYPIMNLHERVLNVLSCKYVDEVIIGSPWCVTDDLIKTLRLNVVCSGSNSKFSDDADLNKSSSQADPYAAAKQAGIYQTIDSTKFLSTNNVIDRIVQNRVTYEKRNTKRSAKEVDYLKKKEYVSEL